MGKRWSKEHDDALRALWKDSVLTTQQIGTALGVKKGAVIGRAHRLGLPGRRVPPVGSVSEEVLTLSTVTDTQCRWPTDLRSAVDMGEPGGTHMECCGAPCCYIVRGDAAERTAYCLDHAKRAYTNTRELVLLSAEEYYLWQNDEEFRRAVRAQAKSTYQKRFRRVA